MTQPELEMRLAVWQKRLRCRDWDITIHSTEGLQSEGVDCWGTCQPDRDSMTARIDVRSDPIPDAKPKPPDWVIVHELMHVLMPSVIPAEHEEPAINRIAWALYCAYQPE